MTIAEMSIEHEGAELVAGARSLVYSRLAEAFAFPSEEFVDWLRTGQMTRELEALADRLPFGLLAPREVVTSPAGLQDSYINLFEVGVGRPFCPLYEGSHRNGRMKLMEDAVRFYEHFGLRTSPGDHPDHLCAELEFMHYMAFKETAALAHGDDAAGIRKAQIDFLDRHLCRWLPRICSRLGQAREGATVYLELAELADDFCRRDLQWLTTA